MPTQPVSLLPQTVLFRKLLRLLGPFVLIALSIPFLCGKCWQVPLKQGVVNSIYSFVMFVTLWKANNLLTQLLEVYAPWLKNPGRRLLLSAVGTLTITLVVVVLLYIIFLSVQGYSWEQMIYQNWTNMVVGPIIITFFITMFMHSKSFLLGWRQTAIDAERLQKENIASQYESLKTQVNPHFLFNSLNALTSLVDTNPELAVKFIKQLSEVYRYVLDSQNKEVVALADELKFVKSYIFLQQIRHGDSLQITFDLPEVSQFQTAPLSVQMLLENAIKHNMILEDQPLHIHLYQEFPDYLVVENNLQVKNTRADSVGLGLNNIRARYQYLADKPVVIEQTEAYFRVKLPLLYFSS